jgi:hypothetical protein
VLWINGLAGSFKVSARIRLYSFILASTLADTVDLCLFQAFLSDLTRVKSDRACLPFGRRDSAPAQAGAAGFPSRIPGPTPLALRLAPSGNGPGHAPLERDLIGPGAQKRAVTLGMTKAKIIFPCQDHS